jgi:hypothetical protein
LLLQHGQTLISLDAFMGIERDASRLLLTYGNGPLSVAFREEPGPRALAASVALYELQRTHNGNHRPANGNDLLQLHVSIVSHRVRDKQAGNGFGK